MKQTKSGNWKTNCSVVFGKRLLDGLPNPPHRVGYKLKTSGRVEPVYCRHEADIAGADEFQEGHPAVAVILCDGDDEEEVGLGELFASPLITGSDALSQLGFLFTGKRLRAADFTEVCLQVDIFVGPAVVVHFGTHSRRLLVTDAGWENRAEQNKWIERLSRSLTHLANDERAALDLARS